MNRGDRPIQVGSNFHFFGVNKVMSLNREKAFGKRLNIVASTAVWITPKDYITPFLKNRVSVKRGKLEDGYGKY